MFLFCCFFFREGRSLGEGHRVHGDGRQRRRQLLAAAAVGRRRFRLRRRAPRGPQLESGRPQDRPLPRLRPGNSSREIFSNLPSQSIGQERPSVEFGDLFMCRLDQEVLMVHVWDGFAAVLRRDPREQQFRSEGDERGAEPFRVQSHRPVQRRNVVAGRRSHLLHVRRSGAQAFR